MEEEIVSTSNSGATIDGLFTAPERVFLSLTLCSAVNPSDGQKNFQKFKSEEFRQRQLLLRSGRLHPYVCGIVSGGEDGLLVRT